MPRARNSHGAAPDPAASGVTKRKPRRPGGPLDGGDDAFFGRGRAANVREEREGARREGAALTEAAGSASLRPNAAWNGHRTEGTGAKSSHRHPQERDTPRPEGSVLDTGRFMVTTDAPWSMERSPTVAQAASSSRRRKNVPSTPRARPSHGSPSATSVLVPGRPETAENLSSADWRAGPKPRHAERTACLQARSREQGQSKPRLRCSSVARHR